MRGAPQGTGDIPAPTIRVSTRLVLVDVVVRDKQGKPVTGLKADDFVIEENGKKQKVATFAAPVEGFRFPRSTDPCARPVHEPSRFSSSGWPS
jgi:VWFA-related protein